MTNIERFGEGWTDPYGVFARDEGTLRSNQAKPGEFGGAPVKVEGGSFHLDPGGVRWFLEAGSFIKPRIIKRIDGAKVVFFEADTNNWVACAPGEVRFLRTAPQGRVRHGTRKNGNVRRWKTPYTAIAAIDREFPCVPVVS